MLTLKKIFVGVSATRLSESGVEIKTKSGSAKIKGKRVYYIVGSYDVPVSKKVLVKPLFLAKSDLVSSQVDFSLQVQHGESFWVGASFRGYDAATIDALVAMFGFSLVKNFRVAYAYDISISSFSAFNAGSHEIAVSYQIPLKDKSVPGKVIYNPRFL